MRLKRSLVSSIFPLAVLVLAFANCGDDDEVGGGGPGARIGGNVVQVQRGLLGRPAGRPRAFALAREALDPRRWLVPEAVAQDAECPDTAAGVLACVDSSHDDDGDGTIECEEENVACDPLDTTTCEFQFRVEVVDPAADETLVFFVDDANGNGTFDGSCQGGPEERATLSPGPDSFGEVCNGDVILIRDVTINFFFGSASAVAIEKRLDGCPRPTPTPTPTPTATPAG